jgi:hypothetical protein
MGSMRGMGEEQADHGVGGSRLGLTPAPHPPPSHTVDLRTSGLPCIAIDLCHSMLTPTLLG